jgi:hypothetical protein
MLFVSATKQAPYGLFAVVLDNGRKEKKKWKLYVLRAS